MTLPRIINLGSHDDALCCLAVGGADIGAVFAAWHRAPQVARTVSGSRVLDLNSRWKICGARCKARF